MSNYFNRLPYTKKSVMRAFIVCISFFAIGAYYSFTLSQAGILIIFCIPLIFLGIFLFAIYRMGLEIGRPQQSDVYFTIKLFTLVLVLIFLCSSFFLFTRGFLSSIRHAIMAAHFLIALIFLARALLLMSSKFSLFGTTHRLSIGSVESWDPAHWDEKTWNKTKKWRIASYWVGTITVFGTAFLPKVDYRLLLGFLFIQFVAPVVYSMIYFKRTGSAINIPVKDSEEERKLNQ